MRGTKLRYNMCFYTITRLIVLLENIAAYYAPLPPKY